MAAKLSTFTLQSDQALRVLKALSNEARLRILALLRERPMNVSEIARELAVAQPTVTNYINQLEEAGLIFTRIQKGVNGYGKLCFLIHDELTFTFGAPERSHHEDEIVLDMPVGHYSGIDVAAPSLLASQSRLLASQEDTSRFFHPDRMEADLLFISRGRVQYLFPYNVPADYRIMRLELSVECSAGAGDAGSAELALVINDRALAPIRIPHAGARSGSRHMPVWFPPEISPAGNMLVWKIDAMQARFNDAPCGRVSLDDLALRPMQPIKVVLDVQDPAGSDAHGEGGVAFFGRNFGRFEQDLRLKIVYEQTGA